MPPSKKRRIDTGSSITTLHQFFNANSCGTKKLGVSRRVKTDAEIIVIDSDDDEVEIVDGSNDSSSRGLTASRKPVQECPVQLEQSNASKNVSSPGPDVTLLSFGFPTLLQPQKVILETNSTADNPTIRGVCVNICDETLEIAQTVTSHQNDELSFVDSPRIFPSDLAMGMGDWGTGDGEMNLVSAREEEDEYAEDDIDGLERLTHCVERDKTKPEIVATNSKNAFSVLMSSFNESESWQEASKLEDRNIRPTKNNRRKAPFYKVLQGMPIAVDAFRYGKIPSVSAYFLTCVALLYTMLYLQLISRHAHADHYTNLSSSWKNGPIYCSEGTANLIIHMLSVDKKWVHPLPMDVPTNIPDAGGVRVTLIEANHCPGSCLFFFEGPQTVDAGDSTYKSPHVGTSKIFRYLHCGDFRASPRHVLHPAVKGKRIDHVYLDTTYLDPKYTFPPQPLIISACAELAKRISEGASLANRSGVEAWVIKNNNKQSKAVGDIRTLFVVGYVIPPSLNIPLVNDITISTYSVGKERVLKGLRFQAAAKRDSRRSPSYRACFTKQGILRFTQNCPPSVPSRR